MPFILSPEQEMVTNAISTDRTIHVKYYDATIAFQAVISKCIDAINCNKSVLIDFHDPSLKTIFYSYLKAYQLSDFTIDISNDGATISEEDIVKLRTGIRKQIDADKIATFEILKHQYDKKIDALNRYFDVYNKPILGHRNVSEFLFHLEEKIDGKRPMQLLDEIHQKDMTISAETYAKVRKDIKDASMMYSNQFSLFDNLSIFHPHLFKDLDEAKTEQIKSTIQHFFDESLRLKTSFHTLSSELQLDIEQDVNEVFDKLEEKLENALETSIRHHTKSQLNPTDKSGFSLFRKKAIKDETVYISIYDDITATIDKISAEWFDELPTFTSAQLTYEKIISFLNDCIAQLEKHKLVQLKESLKTINRINKINAQDPKVKQLDEAINELINHINEAQLFNKNFEQNALSFIKQKSYLTDIVSYLDNALILISGGSSYLSWKRFYKQCHPISKVLINNLKLIDRKAWSDMTNVWFLDQAYQQKITKYNISNNDFEAIYQLKCTIKEAEVSSLHNVLSKQRVAVSETLKSSTKDLHNKLFKKKQLPNTSWDDLALMNRTFMQSFFPIHLTDSLKHTEAYDYVFTFGNAEENENFNVHLDVITQEDIQKGKTSDTYFLYLNHYVNTGPISNLTNTEKLKAAKKLAKFVLSINQEISIYQLKNANIISILPFSDRVTFEQHFDEHGLKSIDTSGGVYDRLTESILFTDRRPFLMIKNNMLNTDNSDSLIWQRHIISLFVQAGYEVISINSEDMIYSKNSFIHSLKSKLIEPTDHKVKTKNMELPEVQESSEINEEAC